MFVSLVTEFQLIRKDNVHQWGFEYKCDTGLFDHVATFDQFWSIYAHKVLRIQICWVKLVQIIIQNLEQGNIHTQKQWKQVVNTTLELIFWVGFQTAAYLHLQQLHSNSHKESWPPGECSSVIHCVLGLVRGMSLFSCRLLHRVHLLVTIRPSAAHNITELQILSHCRLMCCFKNIDYSQFQLSCCDVLEVLYLWLYGTRNPEFKCVSVVHVYST